MSHRYEKLLSPLVLPNGEILKYRMVQPKCSPDQNQGPEEWPTEQFIHFHRESARRGNSLVVFHDADRPEVRKMPDWHDFAHSYHFDTSNPAVQNYICQLADDVHLYGSKVVVSMMTGFPRGVSLGGKSPHHFQTSDDGLVTPPPSQMATKEQIREAIAQCVERCKKYQFWGFDGIALGAMGLDPETDGRTDEYGGSAENRCRFTLELCEALKKACGKKFIICLMHQYANPCGGMGGMKDGYSLDDTITLLKLAQEKNLIDLVQVREQSCVESHPTPMQMKKLENGIGNTHPCVEACRKMKAAGVTIPLAPAGGFQDPAEMEALLEDGVADLISIGRGQFTDEDYLIKVIEERGEDIRPCVRCNRCHGKRRAPWTSVCTVNPTFGVELKMKNMVQPVRKQKKVAVIGGGPAGMEAAYTAAKRGHKVVLFEKSGVLGGQILFGDYFEFKWTFKDFREWQIRQLDQNGVEVRLNTAPTPEDIKAEGFDAVIAALGSTASRPNIEGMSEQIRTCRDIIGKQETVGKNVVMVGCSETGIETAIHLAQNGHNVTCLTRQNVLAKDASPLHSITIAWMAKTEDGYGYMAPLWEKYENIKGITNVTYKSVTPTSVTYLDKDGAEHTIEGDEVIVCGGVKGNGKEAAAFANAAPEFYMVGDCGGMIDMQTGIRSGFVAASQI